MNILGTQYTLDTGSFEIYLAGCSGNPHCTNCHNPESWSFDNGDLWDLGYYTKVERKIRNFNSMIQKIMIFGGEPLDQKEEDFQPFLIDLRSFKKEIWLFTRYDLKDIPEYVKDSCDYIKCGRYMEEFKTEDNTQYGIKLATSNQNIYKKGINY